ncbi:hypothetical protein ACFLWS_07340, partial [Chloroflexota bacterium]
MKSIFTRSVIVILLTLFLMLVLPITSSVRAAGAQKWQFRTENHDTSITQNADDGTQPHPCDKGMSLTWPTSPSYTTVAVPSGKRAWWYMDQAAETNVAFGMGTWQAESHARLDTGKSETAYLRIKAWKVAPDGTATILAEGESEVPLDEDDAHYPIELTPSVSQNVPTGYTVGCSVEWSGTETLYIDYGQTMGGRDGWCQSPSNDPGYPTPELSTIFLMSLGLTTIIVFLYFRH